MPKRKQCPNCNELMVIGAYQCSNCGTNLEKTPVIEVSQSTLDSFSSSVNAEKNETSVLSETQSNVEPSSVSFILKGLAWLSFIACLVMSAITWPDAPRGYDIPSHLYIGPFAFLIAGVVQCVLFLAASQALDYLQRITLATESRSD